MEYKKAHAISYIDLKEACKIFNRHEHLLGTRINTRRRGFDDLMESFIKAVMAVPGNRWKEIPEEIMAFYKTLPAECFEAARITVLKSAETDGYADDGNLEFESKICRTQGASAAGDEAQVTQFSLRKERTPRLVPLVEGKMKIKTRIGLMMTIRHLEELVTALKDGRLFLTFRNRIIMMKPNGPVDIKLAASVEREKKCRREQIAIELEWTRAVDMDWNADNYSISSKGSAN